MKTRVLCWVLLGVALVACHRPKPAPKKMRTSGVVSLPPESKEYIQVEAAEAPPLTASRNLFARVAFDERKVVALGAPVSGRIATIEVTTGATVEKGQKLLTIDSPDLASINADVIEAKHSRLLAQQVAERAELLLSQGAGSQADVDQARASLANAREEEERSARAQTALGGAQQGSAYTLKSPIAGTVVDRAASVGNSVGAASGGPLLTIADLSTVWVLVDVFEQDLPYVRVGNRATVITTELRGQSFEGEVGYVSEVVDATARTARARVELSNPERKLLPGMFAQVAIRGQEVATAWVPTSAVLARRDEYFVFVKGEGDQYRARAVEVGRGDADHTAIVRGLEPGEEVVTRGAILLDAEANAAF